MSEDNQQLGWYEDLLAQEKRHSKALEESMRTISDKLRQKEEENRILRARTKLQHQENREEVSNPLFKSTKFRLMLSFRFTRLLFLRCTRKKSSSRNKSRKFTKLGTPLAKPSRGCSGKNAPRPRVPAINGGTTLFIFLRYDLLFFKLIFNVTMCYIWIGGTQIEDTKIVCLSFNMIF